jgi:hypothetical protein
VFSAARGMPLARRFPQLLQRLLERVGPADAVLERFGAPRGFRRQLPDVLRRLFPRSELRRSRGARGMLALNACRRAQLGFAPARFAGARWGPRTTDTANGPLTRLLPAPSSPPPCAAASATLRASPRRAPNPSGAAAVRPEGRVSVGLGYRVYQ